MIKDTDFLVFTRTLGDEKIKATFRFEASEAVCPAPTGRILLCKNASESGESGESGEGYILGEGGYILELINKGEEI